MDIPVRVLIIRGDLEAMVSISKGRGRVADVDAPPGSMQKRGETIPVLQVSLAGPGTGQRQMHIHVRDLNDGGVDGSDVGRSCGTAIGRGEVNTRERLVLDLQPFCDGGSKHREQDACQEPSPATIGSGSVQSPIGPLGGG